MISETVLIPEPDLPGLSPEAAANGASASEPRSDAKEIGGREGPDPTRYGDWEKNGRCIDF
jgi:hypothetical protein